MLVFEQDWDAIKFGADVWLSDDQTGQGVIVAYSVLTSNSFSGKIEFFKITPTATPSRRRFLQSNKREEYKAYRLSETIEIADEVTLSSA